MRRFVIPVAVLLTALILSGSFFLPSYVSSLRDSQTVGKLSKAEGIDISFESVSKLSLIERLGFVTKSGINLENGKNLDEKTAYQCAITELRSFNAADVMDFDFETCAMAKRNVAFYIDSAEPAKNLIVWNFYIEDASSHALIANIDDETGKLLSMGYFSIYKPKPAKDMLMKTDTMVLTVDPKTFISALETYYGFKISSRGTVKDSRYIDLALTMSDSKNSVDANLSISIDGFWFNM